MSLAIARRYARAVFDLGREKGSLDALVRELGLFADTYASSDDFRQLESMPNLSEAQKKTVVEELGRRLGASDMAVRAVAMLAERQRLQLLPDMAWILAELRDQHSGVVRATVKSAKKLSPEYVARLQQKIEAATGKKVIITTEEDPALIAGVVAQIGDRVIDGSVRGRLDRLSASLRQS